MYSKTLQKHMGYYILVRNVRGNAEACISVVAIFVKNVWGIANLAKNTWGIKQARSRSPRHSYPAGKYLACQVICYSRSLSAQLYYCQTW